MLHTANLVDVVTVNWVTVLLSALSAGARTAVPDEYKLRDGAEMPDLGC